jgi:hypothetical protein
MHDRVGERRRGRRAKIDGARIAAEAGSGGLQDCLFEGPEA